MMKNFEDFQKLNQSNVDATMKVFGEWNKGWQAIAAEMTDYTKRSFEESTATFEKLLSVKSVEQAIEIQTGFAKRAYDGYMHQLSKLGGMYAELAKGYIRSRRRCKTPLSGNRRELIARRPNKRHVHREGSCAVDARGLFFAQLPLEARSALANADGLEGLRSDLLSLE